MRRFTPTTRVAARKSARVSDAVTIAAPPRHTPTGAPGGLPHHALAGALVFRRPRRPRPARGQQPHVDGASPLRARAARAAAAEIRPGAFCALHSAATPHEDPVTTTDADFSCAARRLWRASLYPARFSTPQYNSRCLFARVRFFLYCASGDGPMPTCSYAGSVFLRRAMPPSALPMGAATPYPYRCPRWAATPCPRRRSRLPAPAPPPNSPSSWTTAPRSGPGPLALSPPKLLRPGALRALVFRRPRSRRTRPARGQQPHADGAGPLRARAARAVAAETPSAWRIARALDSAVAPQEDLVTTTISFVRRGAFLLTFSSSESRCR